MYTFGTSHSFGGLVNDAELIGFGDGISAVTAELLAEALCRVYRDTPGAWELYVTVAGAGEHEHYGLGTVCGKHLRPTGADHGPCGDGSSALSRRHRGISALAYDSSDRNQQAAIELARRIVDLSLDRLAWVITHSGDLTPDEIHILSKLHVDRVKKALELI